MDSITGNSISGCCTGSASGGGGGGVTTGVQNPNTGDFKTDSLTTGEVKSEAGVVMNVKGSDVMVQSLTHPESYLNFAGQEVILMGKTNLGIGAGNIALASTTGSVTANAANNLQLFGTNVIQLQSTGGKLEISTPANQNTNHTTGAYNLTCTNGSYTLNCGNQPINLNGASIKFNNQTIVPSSTVQTMIDTTVADAFTLEKIKTAVAQAIVTAVQNLTALTAATTTAAAAASLHGHVVDLDGANDYIEFTGDSVGYLDWSKDWTLGITLDEMGPTSSDAKYMTLFRSGYNAILLRRGGTNYGLYITSEFGAFSHGANVWFKPESGKRVLFTYNATEHKLRYYYGDTSGYSLKATVTLQQRTIDNNSPGLFSIGKGGSGNMLPWDGTVDNMVGSDIQFTGTLIDQYFATPDEKEQEADYYDDLTSWVTLGEDDHPDVVDHIGALTGGELHNGTVADFTPQKRPRTE